MRNVSSSSSSSSSSSLSPFHAANLIRYLGTGGAGRRRVGLTAEDSKISNDSKVQKLLSLLANKKNREMVNAMVVMEL